VGSPIVEIALGKLRGARDHGVFAFKGVPYGASEGFYSSATTPERTAHQPDEHD
jgi:carboxylesterase type B